MKFKPIALMLTLPFLTMGLGTIYANPIGSIEGRVVEKETQFALPGVNVTILNTQLGAATDMDGHFRVSSVPAGSYALQFSFIGYQKTVKTDVIVRSNRCTNINVELPVEVLEMQGFIVTGGYFSETQDQPVSVINFSNEEIRRSAGSHGDVSRIIAMLPSVAPSTDQTNNLVVRGGNPSENAFYVDNIQIPNINHFPTQGSAGGALGILNVDFIQDVNFYSGGFGSAFSDRHSSVMDIIFREGGRDRLSGQFDLNWAGFGFVGEGPIAKQKGSWMFSARRSYLDLLVKNIDVGNSIAPRYGDYQGKVVFDLNQNHKISVLAIWSDDHNRADKDVAVENDMIVFGNQDILQNTTGITWRALWNKNGYSNTSLSYTSDEFMEDWQDTGTEALLLENRSQNQCIHLRNVNHFKFGAYRLEFGLEAKHLISDYNNYYGEQWAPSGQPLPEKTVNSNISAQKIGLFNDFSISPVRKLNMTVGGRLDYFSHNNHLLFAPRVKLAYKLSALTSLNGSAGIYYQHLPLLLYSQNNKFDTLKDTKSTHVIVGLERLVTEDTRLTLELYRKNYTHFPLDPNQPQFFIIDEPFYNNGFYRPYDQLLDSGEAFSQGIEVMLQKKLATNFYGLASATWFSSKYKDLNGEWRARTFDQQFVASIEGGYKPNNKWEISMHWIASGGRPYTPFNVQASKEANTGIVEDSKVNYERYPFFNWLNLRVDRRFNFQRTSMVFYLSVYNVLNRKNVSAYFWNTVQNEQDTIYQWGTLPIFGIEYEF